MEMEKVIFFISSREGFFVTPCCIDCPVEAYCAFPAADFVLDVDAVLGKPLVEIGAGIKVSEPVEVDRSLRTGSFVSASLSHEGVLATYVYDDTHLVQLTDFVENRQVDIEVEGRTTVGFYDDVVLFITDAMTPRESRIKKVFEEHSVEVFEYIVDLEGIDCYIDVSRLPSTKKLLYSDVCCELCEYDFVTRRNRRVGIEKRVCCMGSLTGIDVGVKCVFDEEYGELFTYSLGDDGEVKHVLDVYNESSLVAFIPSLSHPLDLEKWGLKIYSEGPCYINKDIVFNMTGVEKGYNFSSIVRVYKDIFLLHDDGHLRWVLVKILVP